MDALKRKLQLAENTPNEKQAAKGANTSKKAKKPRTVPIPARIVGDVASLDYDICEFYGMRSSKKILVDWCPTVCECN
jgi:hypothetical protein